MKKLIAFTVLLTALLSACTSASTGEEIFTPIVMTAEVSTVISDAGGTRQPFATPKPPTSIPTLAGGMSLTELKYRVLEEFPDFFFCDPDFYPIAREDEMIPAQQAFPEIQANQEEFQAILTRLGLAEAATFTDEQKLQIYREHKKLNAILFQPTGDKYQFHIQTGSEGQQGSVITGTVNGSGSIDVLQREQGFPTCPICLAAGTLIDTPRGLVRVEGLEEGDPVWTVDDAGRRVPSTITQTGRMQVPADHHMIHVILSDGREIWASAGHPTSDGRRLGDLETGHVLDGARIIQLKREPYDDAYTFDILPAGATGFYWANGILIGSTLASP